MCVCYFYGTVINVESNIRELIHVLFSYYVDLIVACCVHVDVLSKFSDMINWSVQCCYHTILHRLFSFAVV